MAVGYLLKVGDKTTCGGVILTGDSFFNIEGQPAATEGSQFSCGKNTGQFIIIGGVDFVNTPSGKSAGTLDGISSCPCGARFIEHSLSQRYGNSIIDKINDRNITSVAGSYFQCGITSVNKVKHNKNSLDVNISSLNLGLKKEAITA